MKISRNHNRGDVTKTILKGIVLGGVIIAVVALPGMAPVLNLFSGKNKKDRRMFNNAMYRMRSQKMVKVYYKDGEEVIEITEKGKRRLLKYEFDEMKIKIPKKWDGLWRIVIFDIPEKRKKARNAINMKLKELGFYPIQKSTFIFPYECRNEVDFVAEHFFARKYINYIVAKEVDGSDKLKKSFKI
jgi:DNA-binding transcriptional regulator PaaX